MGGPAHSTPSSATADVAKLLGKLEAEHVQGLILDLRRNGGGSLEEAISLTGLFIHAGPVVQTRELDGHTDVREDNDAAELYRGPLIVLTSRFSASASEILAGALQDYGRALIVGDTSTYGKGTVQSVVSLAPMLDRSHLAYSADPGALKITIRKFYRPGGASTQLKGVAADIALPSLTDATEVGEATGKNPLPWDQVSPAKFTREDHVSAFLPELRADSAARVAGDQDFTYLREDMARLRHNLESKTISLNEPERRREKEEAMARAALRSRERAASHESPPTTYEITVNNADAPGLPAPRTPGVTAAPKTSELLDDEIGDVRANTPPNDPDLREAERILADYAAMVLRAATVAVTVP
jgi:carboxyl-terminal processing protease